MVFFRDSEVNTGLDKRKELADQINNYEVALVQEHLGLDLYRSKNKSKNQISFNDLTLVEQLNYVKYTLKNTEEACKMFDIVTADEQASVACALVQKIANKTHSLPKEFTHKNEFRAMLKLVQKQANKLDTKNLVDTLYSLGKLKKNLPQENYLQYVVGDLVKESTRRIEQLQQMEIAYFVKGLTNLHNYINTHP